MGSMKDLFGDDLFDVEKSRAARDAGIDLVAANNAAWFEAVMHMVESLSPGWTGTGEDIRRLATEHNCGKPGHHNAWGSVISHSVRRKLLVRTGRRLKMRSVRSHARQTDEYYRAD